MARRASFLPGTPPVVRQASAIERAHAMGALGLLVGVVGSGASALLVVESASASLRCLGVTGILFGVLVAVVSLAQSPRAAVVEDARAVLAEWRERRACWAKVAVDRAIADMEEADPALVDVWESGRGAEAALGVRSRT